MTTTQQVENRRELHYSNLNDIITDAESLASGEYRTSGNWTFGQILEHLAMAMDCSIDGFGFKAPWLVRTFVAPVIKNRVFSKPMPAGFKLPAKASRLQPGDVTVEEGLEHLKRAIARYETETPSAPHPFFGKLARQEWVSLTLRHAELHMSFVHPAS